MENTKKIEEYFNKMLNLKARNVQLGHGSFITMGFGNDIIIQKIVRGEIKNKVRPEWFLWIYMCRWELVYKSEIKANSEDERDEIEKLLQKIEGNPLIRCEAINEFGDIILDFEGGVTLKTFANNSEEDYEQWMLYTPERKVLVAGPMNKLSYSSA